MLLMGVCAMSLSFFMMFEHICVIWLDCSTRRWMLIMLKALSLWMEELAAFRSLVRLYTPFLSSP